MDRPSFLSMATNRCSKKSLVDPCKGLQRLLKGNHVMPWERCCDWNGYWNGYATFLQKMKPAAHRTLSFFSKPCRPSEHHSSSSSSTGTPSPALTMLTWCVWAWKAAQVMKMIAQRELFIYMFYSDLLTQVLPCPLLLRWLLLASWRSTSLTETILEALADVLHITAGRSLGSLYLRRNHTIDRWWSVWYSVI